MKRRIVQRTPNLGVTLRMQPVGGVTADCVPDIGPARWYDWETKDFTAPIAYGKTSIGDYGLRESQIFWTGKVTGELCGATVSWVVDWEVIDYGESPAWLACGEGIAVCSATWPENTPSPELPPGYFARYNGSGILTATPTVHLGSSLIVVEPIILIISSEY